MTEGYPARTEEEPGLAHLSTQAPSDSPILIPALLACIRPRAHARIHQAACAIVEVIIVAIRCPHPAEVVTVLVRSPGRCNSTVHPAAGKAVGHRMAAKRASADVPQSAAETSTAKMAATSKVSTSAATSAYQYEPCLDIRSRAAGIISMCERG
jgi:hypothetical protein